MLLQLTEALRRLKRERITKQPVYERSNKQTINKNWLLLLLSVNTTDHSTDTSWALQYARGGLGGLEIARWAGWSGVQMGRHVKCWSRSDDL